MVKLADDSFETPSLMFCKNTKKKKKKKKKKMSSAAVVISLSMVNKYKNVIQIVKLLFKSYI